HQAAELAASGLAVCVGEIVERGGLWLKHPDGTEQPLALAGWKHGFTPPAEGPAPAGGGVAGAGLRSPR
ncbi:MAG: hypothetical protein ACKO3P_23155, partial [Planctomycetaceae bacterium]